MVSSPPRSSHSPSSRSSLESDSEPPTRSARRSSIETAYRNGRRNGTWIPRVREYSPQPWRSRPQLPRAGLWACAGPSGTARRAPRLRAGPPRRAEGRSEPKVVAADRARERCRFGRARLRRRRGASRAGGSGAAFTGPAQQLFERHQPLRVHQLQHAQFQMETLLLLVAELIMRAQHDLQETREVFFAEVFRDARDARPFVGGNLQQRRFAARNLGHEALRRKRTSCRAKCCGLLPFRQQLVNDAATRPHWSCAQRDSSCLRGLGGNGAHQSAHGFGAEAGAAARRSPGP